MAKLIVKCLTNQYKLVRAESGGLVVSSDDTDLTLSLIPGNTYVLLGVECGWFRVIDEEGEDYLYPSNMFEAMDDKLGE